MIQPHGNTSTHPLIYAGAISSLIGLLVIAILPHLTNLPFALYGGITSTTLGLIFLAIGYIQEKKQLPEAVSQLDNAPLPAEEVTPVQKKEGDSVSSSLIDILLEGGEVITIKCKDSPESLDSQTLIFPKNILIKHSEYFKSHFDPIYASNGQVDFSNYTREEVRCYLSFICRGTIPNGISPEHMLALLEIGDYTQDSKLLAQIYMSLVNANTYSMQSNDPLFDKGTTILRSLYILFRYLERNKNASEAIERALLECVLASNFEGGGGVLKYAISLSEKHISNRVQSITNPDITALYEILLAIPTKDTSVLKKYASNPWAYVLSKRSDPGEWLKGARLGNPFLQCQCGIGLLQDKQEKIGKFWIATSALNSIGKYVHNLSVCKDYLSSRGATLEGSDDQIRETLIKYLETLGDHDELAQDPSQEKEGS